MLKTHQKSNSFFNFLFVFVAGFLAAIFLYTGLERNDISSLEDRLNALEEYQSDVDHKFEKTWNQVDENSKAGIILLQEHNMRNDKLERMVQEALIDDGVSDISINK